MKILIEISESQFADIQRIASVQLEGRLPTVEQIIASGTPFKRIVNSQPTIEPKKGRWIECDHDKWNGDTFAYRCSKCGGAYHLNIEQTIGVWDFCPNCGADMRGEQNE